MKRRNFIKVGTLTAGGLLINISFSCMPEKKGRVPGKLHKVNLYLSINTNGEVEITNPVPEIGQGVSNALPMLVAEELEVSWKDVTVKQADAGVDFEGRNQRAAGSNSIRSFYIPMRQAGATARMLLIRAAADTWMLDPSSCYVELGEVYNRMDDRSLAYGDLVTKAATYEPLEEIKLKDKSDFKLLGTQLPNKNIREVISGEIKFGQDIRVDRMYYANIKKCKTYGATVISFNEDEVMAMDGIYKVFKVPFHGDIKERPYCREGVAIVGESVWAVLKGREALKVEWDPGVNKNLNTDELHETCRKLLNKNGKDVVKNDGDVYRAFSEAGSNVLEAEYHVPFIVHIPMETVNCTIDLKENSCELWSTTQMPFIELNFLADFLEMPVENITIHIPRIGGGFGRRLSLDFTIEAVKVAQEIKKPIQLFWTREDDIQMDACRPFSYHKMMAAFDDKSNIRSWLHRQSGTSRHAFRPNSKPHRSEFFPNHFPANLVSNFRQEYTLAETNIERTLIRAPGNNALAFPVESFMDELSHTLKKDPLDFRLELLGKGDKEFLFEEEDNIVISTGRMKKVLRTTAAKAGWGTELPMGRGMGIAGYFTFESYVAHIAEVSVDPVNGDITIHKFTSAVDCGEVINPDGVRAQVEGSIMDGLSVALHQEITVSDGGIDQTNFHDYHVMRMPEAPKEIDVYIVENDYPPTGMGEPPYPPVAPALCNAIFAACGIRIRKLPIKNQLKERIQNA